MVKKQIVHADYNFSDEKLYYRTKIDSFEINDIEALCLYFPKNNSFFVSYLLDFLEVKDSITLNKIKLILTKDLISMTDISDLIIIFGNFSESLTHEEAMQISLDTFKDLDINNIYFSV